MRELYYTGPRMMLTRASNGFWYFFDPEDTSVGMHMLLLGEHEPAYSAVWQSFLVDGDIIAVVGSNIGYHDVEMCVVSGSKTRIYSFEPNPENLRYLRRNALYNGCGGRIEIFPYAITDTPGEEFFYVFTGDSGGGSLRLLPVNEAKDHARIAVKTTSIDEFFTQRDIWPTVIKIDAEGSEARILRGAFRGFSEKLTRVAFFEHNPDYFVQELEDITNNILEIGYSLWRIDVDSTECPFVRETRPISKLPACDLALLRETRS